MNLGPLFGPFFLYNNPRVSGFLSSERWFTAECRFVLRPLLNRLRLYRHQYTLSGKLRLWAKRMMLYLSAIFACRENNPLASIPGTLVFIGMNSPRYSLGASGFMSYISMCGRPPGSQTKITEVPLPDTPGASFFACASSKP